jgi:hypothetical protein
MTPKETKALRSAEMAAAEHGYALFRGLGDRCCSYLLIHEHFSHLAFDTHPSRPIPSRAEVLAPIMAWEQRVAKIVATATRQSREEMHGATLH